MTAGTTTRSRTLTGEGDALHNLLNREFDASSRPERILQYGLDALPQGAITEVFARRLLQGRTGQQPSRSPSLHFVATAAQLL